MKKNDSSQRGFYKTIIKLENLPSIIKVLILTVSSWLFQGLVYMDRTEKVFKILLDILFLIPFSYVVLLFDLGIIGILISFLIAHTLNWVFNSQIFALIKQFNLIKTDYKSFNKYLERLKKKLKNEPSVVWAGVFGSLVRGELKETSDLDVRLVRKPGSKNGLRACFFVMKERTWALINRFPLDIYVLDDIKSIKRHIIKIEIEKMIIIYDKYEISKEMLQ